jgi:hypothetical protein
VAQLFAHFPHFFTFFLEAQKKGKKIAPQPKGHENPEFSDELAKKWNPDATLRETDAALQFSEGCFLLLASQSKGVMIMRNRTRKMQEES